MQDIEKAGIFLNGASQAMYEFLKRHLVVTENGPGNQIDQIFLPLQKPRGDRDDFIVLAFPVPRLTLQQRLVAKFSDAYKLTINGEEGTVILDIDEFAKINWITVQRWPLAFDQITEALLSETHRQGIAQFPNS